MDKLLETRLHSLLDRIQTGSDDQGLCVEAIELVFELEDSGGPLHGASEITPEEELALCAKEKLLDHLLCRRGLPFRTSDLERLLSQSLQDMERRYQAALENASLLPGSREAELSLLTDRSRWLELISLRYLERVSIEPLKDLFIELDLWEQTVHVTNDENAFPGSMEPLRFEALLEQAENLELGARSMLDQNDTDAERLWEMLLQVWGMQHKVAADQPVSPNNKEKSRAVLFQLAEAGDRLREAVQRRLGEMQPDDRLECGRRWTDELQGRIEEILFLADDQSLERGYDIAYALSIRLQEFQEMLATAHSGDNGTEHKKGGNRNGHKSRKLKRLMRRVRNDLQEKQVQIGLEGLMGRRGVVWLENTVLFLILAVVGLLLYEAWADPPERVITILMWIDTGICAVFLTEFFLRISYAKRKWLYFRRHFVIDFLPAIPFGLFAHGLQALNYIRGARALRFLRLPRLVRYVRVARPMVRLFRVFIFLMRGLDRVVARQAGLLNRNVVAFAKIESGSGKSQAFRLMRLRSRTLAHWRKTLATLPENLRVHRLRRWFFCLQKRLELRGEWLDTPAYGAGAQGAQMRIAKEIRLERVLETLLDLDSTQVETRMGRETAERMTRIIRLFQAPLIRRLPFFASGARLGATLDDPCDIVAEFGRRIGRFGQKILSAVYWCADLSGTMTPTQFLEMVGSAVIRATTRPARRLIMMGGAFLLIDWTFALFQFTLLRNLSQRLGQIMGWPLIALGGFCLLLLLVGQWFRKIASEASDFYEHTAEAHFLALMEDVKEARAEADIETLFSRVLYPECVMQGWAEGRKSLVSDSVQRLCGRLKDAVAAADDTPLDTKAGGYTLRSGYEAYYWLLEDRVLALFRDYLDGALLHKNDTKTTNQLLGNLTLQKIWTERLGLPKSERKRLDKLDLERERSFLGGPYMWFKFITHSVSQRTAKLLIDYNRNVIPLDDLNFVTEDQRLKFSQWLTGLGNANKRQDLEEQASKPYFTTEFTALNFLSSDPARDHAILERFGPQVLDRLQRDRKMLIRNLFGSYPLHRLPKERRTFNPYRYYQQKLAGGRIFLFPLLLLAGLFKGLWAGLKSLAHVAHELLDPETFSDPGENLASFDVAERKIARMRRPVFWEAMRLRAQFDPEYLGLTIPGLGGTSMGETSCWDDLKWIEARDEELDFFRDLLSDREDALERLHHHLEKRGIIGDYLETYLEALRPGLSRRKGEALRAAAVAYAVDYHGLRSSISGLEEISAIFESMLENPAKLPRIGMVKHLVWMIKSLWRRRFFLRPDPVRQAYRKVLSWTYYGEAGRKQKRILWRAVQTDVRNVRRRIMRLAESDSPEAAAERGRELLDEVLARPHSWTDEMVVLRTVQTMSVLDIRNYQVIVRTLGGYR
jgi:hypothetical protein